MSDDIKVSDAIKPTPAMGWATRMQEEYKSGADDVEIMAALGISRKEFEKNYSDNPIFKQLVDIGRVASAAWWRSTARKNIFNKDFNNSVWSFTMKNRFGWTDKSETTLTDTQTQSKSIDELRADILAKIPGLAKQLGVAKKEAEALIVPEKKLDE